MQVAIIITMSSLSEIQVCCNLLQDTFSSRINIEIIKKNYVSKYICMYVHSQPGWSRQGRARAGQGQGRANMKK